MPSSSGSGSGSPAQVDSSPPPHYPSILLSTPTDAEWLSPALCLLRRQIEYFAARPHDLTAKNRSGGNKAAVVVGQVGIRCVWCRDCPRGERSKGSELYPSNIGLIHQAVRNYQRHHYKSCTRLPAHVRSAIEQAKTQPGRKRQSKSNSKDYWSQSAREAGLVDNNGIFFADSEEEEVPEEVPEEVEQDQVDEQEHVAAGGQRAEEEEVQVQVQAAAADVAAPLPFDSIALFGPGLGLIDDDDDDDDDHHEAIGAAEKPHQVEQEAVQEATCMYSSAPAPAPAPVSHHSTTSEADDAMLHEALTILSDDAEDEVGSEDGTAAGFEPLPVRKEELRSTYSTAMSIPPPTTTADYPQSNTLTAAANLGCSMGILSEGSAQAPTAGYGARGPSHTWDRHPLTYSSGLFSSSGTTGTTATSASTTNTTASHHHGQQYPQPRRHSTMGSSYRTAAEQQQQQYQQMYQAQQQYRQPRRFSLAGTVSPHRNYHHHYQDGQAAEDYQQRQHMHMHMHMQSFRNHPSSTSSASEKVAPMIPFASPIDPPPSYAQAPAPLAMPLPLPTTTMASPATTMTNGAKRRSSVVSSTSDSGCNSPATATPSTSRSSSYGFTGAALAGTEETMVFPSPAGTSIESNKRARCE